MSEEQFDDLMEPNPTSEEYLAFQQRQLELGFPDIYYAAAMGRDTVQELPQLASDAAVQLFKTKGGTGGDWNDIIERVRKALEKAGFTFTMVSQEPADSPSGA